MLKLHKSSLKQLSAFDAKSFEGIEYFNIEIFKLKFDCFRYVVSGNGWKAATAFYKFFYDNCTGVLLQ